MTSNLRPSGTLEHSKMEILLLRCQSVAIEESLHNGEELIDCQSYKQEALPSAKQPVLP